MCFRDCQIEQLKQELNRKESEMQALQTKLETLTNQNSDCKQHIEVLKESLSAKEQRANTLQTEVSTHRNMHKHTHTQTYRIHRCTNAHKNTHTDANTHHDALSHPSFLEPTDKDTHSLRWMRLSATEGRIMICQGVFGSLCFDIGLEVILF